REGVRHDSGEEGGSRDTHSDETVRAKARAGAAAAVQQQLSVRHHRQHRGQHQTNWEGQPPQPDRSHGRIHQKAAELGGGRGHRPGHHLLLRLHGHAQRAARHRPAAHPGRPDLRPGRHGGHR
ncbi:hypothetical protein FOCC_FOCC010896, partial [Frankliniella occidentalis]